MLARHSAFMGTTGGGKSTTVSGQVDQYQKAEMATVIFDTEGEYTEMGRPTEDETMVELLKREKRVPPESRTSTYTTLSDGTRLRSARHR